MSESGFMNAVARWMFRLCERQQWHRNWNRTPKSRHSDSGKFRNCCRVLTASPPRGAVTAVGVSGRNADVLSRH